MRVVIAEDAALMREGLIRLLEDRGHEVCAAVADGDAMLAAVAEHRPDVAVVDIRMPPTHTDEGLRAALELRRRHPGTGVLVFSQYIETRYAARLLAGDAAGVGYLLKDRVADVAEFVDALARVAAGGTALDPEVVSQLLGASRHLHGLAALTPREREVLSLMAEGRSNAGIASALVVSVGAVEHLLERYGSLTLEVLALVGSDPELAHPLDGAPEYLAAEVSYAVRAEAALHLEDVLARRTRVSIETAHRGVESAIHAASLMSSLLGWDHDRRSREIDHYLARVEAERESQRKPDDRTADAARLGAPDVRGAATATYRR